MKDSSRIQTDLGPLQIRVINSTEVVYSVFGVRGSGLRGAVMSVYYKFKTQKNWDAISFDNAVISVLDLKRAIVRQKKLDKNSDDFDLLLTNSQTGERKSNKVPAIHLSSLSRRCLSDSKEHFRRSQAHSCVETARTGHQGRAANVRALHANLLLLS
jgi:hypothetical protein